MAAITSVGETPLAGPGRRQGGMQAGRRRRLNIFRYLTFTVFGLFFLLPLLATLRFSLEGKKLGTWSGAAWGQIVSYPGLLGAIEVTLEVAVITCLVVLLLLVPTMIWIRLKVPGISRVFEFLCLLPFWVYVILALPYAYRALAAGLGAIAVTTLSEAARSLGASWFTVMFRVIAPNMWQAILNALLLTSALVLGEFTIASILNYNNILQVALFDISRSTTNAGVLFSTSLAALLFAFALLLILSYVGRRRRGHR